MLTVTRRSRKILTFDYYSDYSLSVSLRLVIQQDHRWLNLLLFSSLSMSLLCHLLYVAQQTHTRCFKLTHQSHLVFHSSTCQLYLTERCSSIVNCISQLVTSCDCRDCEIATQIEVYLDCWNVLVCRWIGWIALLIIYSCF